jgi:hypothetical protein
VTACTELIVGGLAVHSIGGQDGIARWIVLVGTGRKEQRTDQQKASVVHGCAPFTIMLLVDQYANNTHSCLRIVC